METSLNELTAEKRKEYVQNKIQGNLEWVTTLTRKVEEGILPRNATDQMIARALTAREIKTVIANDRSKRDPLTNLYNKGAFNEEYERVIRDGSKFALLIIDIDNFKAFNEEFDYLTGDRVLMQISLDLSTNLRQFRENEAENDTIFRWGGEEFVVIAKDISKKEDLEKVAEKLRESICERSFSIKVKDKDIDVPITVSIGGSIYRGGDKNLFFTNIHDNAVKQAKNTGRNKTVIIGE